MAYRVTDGDGDAVTQALTVNVDDDMPVLGTAASLAVDEDDLTSGPASFAGNFMPAEFGISTSTR